MARPLRIEFSGALYHVTSRGNARQDIFLVMMILRTSCGFWVSPASDFSGIAMLIV